MSSSLQILILLLSIFLYLSLFTFFKRGRILLKFLLVWLFPTTIIFFIGVIPSFLQFFTDLLGFQTMSNMVVGVLFVILIFICISLTIIVSGQDTKINLLIQEVSLLKEKIECEPFKKMKGEGNE